MDVKKIKNKEDFILFLNELCKDFEQSKKGSPYGGDGSWQNIYVNHFIESIIAWLNSNNEIAKKYTQKTKLEWGDLAEIFYIGKIYE